MAEPLDPIQEARESAGLDPFADVKQEEELLHGKKDSEDEEDTEDDKNEDDESDEDEEDSDEEGEDKDNQDDDDDSDDDEDSRPDRTVPIKVHNELRREKRKEAREWAEEKGRLEKQIADLEKPTTELTDDQYKASASKLIAPKGEKETDEQYNGRLNISIGQLKEMGTLFNAGQKLPQELASKLEEFQDQASFNSEWDKQEDKILKEHPNLTMGQLRLARKAMDELSHAPQFADKELDYVAYKNKDIFDEIFKPVVKHSFESRERRAAEDKTADKRIDPKNYDPSKATIEDMLAASKQMQDEADAGGMSIMHNGEDLGKL